jgi:hypothetical protein
MAASGWMLDVLWNADGNRPLFTDVRPSSQGLLLFRIFATSGSSMPSRVCSTLSRTRSMPNACKAPRGHESPLGLISLRRVLQPNRIYAILGTGMGLFCASSQARRPVVPRRGVRPLRAGRPTKPVSSGLPHKEEQTCTGILIVISVFPRKARAKPNRLRTLAVGTRRWYPSYRSQAPGAAGTHRTQTLPTTAMCRVATTTNNNRAKGPASRP